MRLIEDWRQDIDKGLFVGAVLMDLSKAFDCIPHDLLIAKLNAYGISKASLILIYSYLKGRRQSVKVNGTLGGFLTLLSGVPQGSILGPLLFNLYINDFYYLFQTATLHGFADDNTLSAQANTLAELIKKLENETEIAIKWLKYNQMLANSSKFQTILISKEKGHIKASITIDGQQIESKLSVVLLGNKIDNKLKFEEHIGELCKKAANQLNSLYKFRKFMTPFAKKIATNSFVKSNFSYCPLIWHFCPASSKSKIEKIGTRANKLCGLETVTFEIKRLRQIAIEIYKTLHDMNPPYIKDIFKKRTGRTSQRLANNIKCIDKYETKFGKNSLRYLGPILWNSLPHHIKALDNFDEFKDFMKHWGEPGCPHYNRYINYINSF